MNNTRRQLSLFVDPQDADAIEELRKTYNPKQFELIPAHVTLCREDEIEDLQRVLQNLESLAEAAITVDFGEMVRFSDGNGVLIPAIGENNAFHSLRKRVLQGIIESPRRHEPHITLMHPRNATCTDEIFERIRRIPLSASLKFAKICLIEQEMGQKWEILRTFDLKNSE